jgi:hypothetical protein
VLQDTEKIKALKDLLKKQAEATETLKEEVETLRREVKS